MVNNGASGACHACKKKRKKCDEARPSCLRCRRAYQDCPGYEVSKDRKFINYIADAARNILHPRFTSLSHTTSNSTQLSAADWPGIEQNARSVFFEEYCIIPSNKDLSRGYLDGLQTMIVKAGPNSELIQAEGLYSLLLRSFRLSISNEAIFTTIESLITAALLGLYEIIISTDAYPGAHVGHARGVSAILVSKYSPFNLICGGKLFQVASPILLENMEVGNSKSPPLLDTPVGTQKESQRFSVLCTPLLNRSSLAIDLIYAQITPLIRRAESLLGSEATLDQLRHLKSEAQQMKEAYDAWPKTVPDAWKPRSEGYIVFKDDDAVPHVGYWPGTISSYYDPYVASIWNCHRKAGLLVLNIIMSCQRRIDSYSNGPEIDTSTQKDVSELVQDIVSSIPYLLATDLQAFLKNATSGSPPFVPARPVGALLSMYTLYVLSTLPIVEEKLRVYIKDCLAWVGTHMGIGQATILSKCKSMDQFDYATEARVIIWTGMLI